MFIYHKTKITKMPFLLKLVYKYNFQSDTYQTTSEKMSKQFLKSKKKKI